MENLLAQGLKPILETDLFSEYIHSLRHRISVLTSKLLSNDISGFSGMPQKALAFQFGFRCIHNKAVQFPYVHHNHRETLDGNQQMKYNVHTTLLIQQLILGGSLSEVQGDRTLSSIFSAGLRRQPNGSGANDAIKYRFNA
ncbi:hypothetical protein V6N13_109315 [Hibiscus sabdariffa]|uniref:Uncharacterized protein n=1 Tax=Hibiscus sabdariffa TaxID=183260 RepID=A0ABR2FPC8_9ROSI